MSDAKHTPGPWRVCGWENLVVNAANGETIVACPGGSLNTTLPELQANAALIARAPAPAAECDALRAEVQRLRDALAEIGARGPVPGYEKSVSALMLRLAGVQSIARAALDQPAP
jgi:hypothetical protein